VKQVIVNGYRFLEGMEPLLRELTTSSSKLWALSNYSPWIELLRQRLDLDRYFEAYVVSCVTGFRKPDPRAYEALLNRANLAPGLCLFVDDRQENVSAALRLGMQALLFQDAADLREQLRSRKMI
jgi:putative hydrolase of the HAD superfamily